MDTLTEPRWTVDPTVEADWAPEGRHHTEADHDCTGEPGGVSAEEAEAVMAGETVTYPAVDELLELGRPCRCGDDLLDHQSYEPGTEGPVGEAAGCMVAGCPCEAYDEDPEPAAIADLAEIVGDVELADRIHDQAAAELARREADGTLPTTDRSGEG